jgi:hypothetical protein
VTRAEALLRLERMLGGSTPPKLSPEELGDLLDAAALADASGRARSSDTPWTGATAYDVGALVVPTFETGRLYRVTVAGTSGEAEPLWPSSGTVVLDGVTYELDTTTTPTAWKPTYDLAVAAAEGWRQKAGLTSDRFRFGEGGDSYERQQVFEHCLKMAGLYESKAAAGGAIVGDSGAGQSGAGTFTLPRSDTRVGLELEERVIVLERWDGSGELPRIN